VRVGVHQFETRVAAQIERFIMDGASDWTPPFSLTDEDRALHGVVRRSIGLEARVLVCSRKRDTASALCDALRLGGYMAEWRLPSEAASLTVSADIIVWDFPAGLGESAAEFAKFAERAPGIPVVVVLGFVRASDKKSAEAQGAKAVLCKPFSIDDLLWQLAECLWDQRPGRRRVA
jgi:DNA-binding NtrC family response regulator